MTPVIRTSPYSRNKALDYLRAFVTVLVVGHHSALAYHSYAPPPRPFTEQPLMWAAFPVVDAHKWAGIDLFVGFNDTFFMALMFLLSGLFVWSSLQRKGAGDFIRDRMLRLGVPFVVAAALLAPLAYYPAYRATATDSGFAAYAHAWMSLGGWPAGPAWFIWVLLAFACVAALLFKWIPGWGAALGERLGPIGERPLVFFIWLAAISALAYVPMTRAFDSLSWTSFGPFYFQTSRILHYAAYFLVGIVLGAYGIERGLLAVDGKLARRWPLWVVGALAAFVFVIATVIIVIGLMTKGEPSGSWEIAAAFAFVLCSAAVSLALLAVFLRFFRTSRPVLDSLARNAYGIYLLHYAFVSWLQFALLDFDWTGSAKGSLVFFGALGLSWATTAAVRRVPAIARVI